jgi:hypothetical protein
VRYTLKIESGGPGEHPVNVYLLSGNRIVAEGHGKTRHSAMMELLRNWEAR